MDRDLNQMERIVQRRHYSHSGGVYLDYIDEGLPTAVEAFYLFVSVSLGNAI